ncbi:hypothetical protein ACWDOP_15005 [Nocardia sp. NPDC003693]
MEITSSRCRAFEYTVTAPAACAVDIDAALIGVANSFTDCITVSIALQRGADPAIVGAATRTILDLAARADAAQIVINGDFRPPPRTESDWPCRDVLAELADALDSVTAIAQRLTKAGRRVHLMPFGWHTEIRVEVRDRDRRCIGIAAGPPSFLWLAGFLAVRRPPAPTVAGNRLTVP